MTATSDVGSSSSGTWNLIYDQAISIELNNGMRFITSFRYNVKDYVSPDPLAEGAKQSQLSSLSKNDY